MNCCKIAHHEMYTIYSNGDIHSGKTDLFLKPRKNKNGYLIVTLDKEQYLLHRLVALHFIPNPYRYSQVNHIDGNKENNDVLNLEWCSAAQNIEHSLKENLRKGYIHVEDKRRLLKEVLAGKTVLEVVKEFPNTHPNTLNRMLRNQAIKDGLEKEWAKEAKRKRKLTAVKNLKKVNDSNKENR